MKYMISVRQARELVNRYCRPIEIREMSLAGAGGMILAREVKAPVNLPGFHQSAMDGYAFRYTDFNSDAVLRLQGEIQAGSRRTLKMKKGTAVRIFTGAPLPKGADTVVMQEKTIQRGDQIFINDVGIRKGANVRKAGSQIKKGTRALGAGARLSPGAIGFLAAMGKKKVGCYSHPEISIIVNGNELNSGKKVLQKGEIFESNSHALNAALQTIQMRPKQIMYCKDDLKALTGVLQKALRSSDLIILTGGISVGNYDFTAAAMKKAGVKTIFYKIRQKPGKPMFFGKKGRKIVFALPGNPAAALTCFYEYVLPGIRSMMGCKSAYPKPERVSLSENFGKKKGLALFLKGSVTGHTVRILEGQESYILRSFATANCIVYLPEETEWVKKGADVEIVRIPGITAE